MIIEITERFRSSRLLRRVSDPLAVIGRMLFCNARLTASIAALSCIPFFIIGSGRSGNTLLRAMLMQHADIVIPPESKVLPNVIRKFHRYRFLPWSDLVQLVIAEFERPKPFSTWQIDFRDFRRRALSFGKEERSLAILLDRLYMFYGEKKRPSAVRWGDKTPVNTLRIEKLNWVFPHARFVHMIRDGRDVVSSTIEFGMHSTVEEAASRWLASVERAQRAGRKMGPERYLEIRYEHLALEPAQTLQRVSAFLDLEYLPEMLDFWKSVDELGDAHFPFHANLGKPVNPESIGSWRQRLGAREQEVVQRLLGPKLVDLGYLGLLGCFII